jgi:pilus assembly protein CpaC
MNQVQVRVVNKAFWLEGVVNSKLEKERAFRIANAYMPDKIESLAQRTDSVAQAQREWIQDFISISEKKPPQPVPKLIKITAQFVELTKDYLRTFGFKWSPTLSTGGQIEFGKTTTNGVTTKGSGTLSGVISNLFPKLASAKNAGHARVIQQGVVLVQNGIEAVITKGSTKRYTSGTGDFTKDGQATAGFSVKVTPNVMQNENIQLKTGIDVSSNVGEPPETLKNTLSTTVVVKSKESAVIGGVVVNKSSTAYDRDPPFGKTVVDTKNADASTLFSFLRSKSYLSSKSQFVIFVTPEIVDSASTGTEQVKRKFRRRRR